MVIRLFLNNRKLELSEGSYSETVSNVDTVNTSESGTKLRAVTRTGIPQLDCSYKCDNEEVAFLEECSKAIKLTATKWSESNEDYESWDCYMTGLSKSLIVETPEFRFYNVSFSLVDLEV